MDQEEKNQLALRYAKLALRSDKTPQEASEMRDLEVKLQMSPQEIINLVARLTIPSSN